MRGIQAKNSAAALRLVDAAPVVADTKAARPDPQILTGPTEATLFPSQVNTASPGSRAVATAKSALEGLSLALEQGKLPRGRVVAATNALEQVQKHVKPGQSAADRQLLSDAVERLRAALLGLGPVDADPGLRKALEPLVKAFNARTYDLGLEPLGFIDTARSVRFVSYQEQLAAVPEGISDMSGAPAAPLADGTQVVPGQFRQFRITPEIAQEIVAKIDLPPGLVAFVGQDPQDGVPYVQIGVIGPDNYGDRDANPDKLVYGRRWRIEPALPEYELVQTVFAAARDALDHETREMFTVGGKTPFSGHVDTTALGRMLKTGTLSTPENRALKTLEEVQSLLDLTRFAGQQLKVLETELRPRTGSLTVVFELVPGPTSLPLPAFDGKVFEARAEGTQTSDILHGINEEFRRAALRHLEERFAFDGMVRFSREVDPLVLAEASLRARKLGLLEGGPVSASGAAFNAAVETARAPTIEPGPATERAVDAIQAQAPLLGNPPKRRKVT